MLRLYNTLTRSKEPFVPADPKRVTMYVCGPTVYNRAHIGNARPAVVFDLLARLLRHHYGAAHVLYARNITDIDDRIIEAAAFEGVPIDTVTARYEKHYVDDTAALGVLPPDFTPHATHHIPGMVSLIERLIARGHAYAADGHVLFDVPSFPGYGRLSRRPMDEMIAGARVEVAPYKRSPQDFVLWKPSTPDQPGWDSPWGRGRPGWHIECSAMIASILGETIDIHGGGLDLTFPHHENEIAQSECGHGHPLARVWMHNGFLSMGTEKMSKSLGNVVSVGDLLADGHSGDVLRLALLFAHYRQPLEWTSRSVEQAKARLDRWKRKAVPGDTPHPSVIQALDDDLNTPGALAALDALDDPAALGASLALLGIGFETESAADPRIDVLMAERTAARAARNWAESDRIRDLLAAEGVILEDSAAGTVWRRA
jgi:cysteinyl-tRNA synthetase